MTQASDQTSAPATPPSADNPAEAAAPQPASAAAELEAALAAAQAKADENWERYLRATAEQDNIRKRAEREVDQARRFAVERLAKDLIGVLDSLDLGLQSADAGAEAAAGSSQEPLLEGMRLTRKLCADALARHGVQAMDPQGAPFDPARHEAMSAVPSAEHPANTVINVVQKGYMLHERVLRPAMVVVAQAPPES